MIRFLTVFCIWWLVVSVPVNADWVGRTSAIQTSVKDGQVCGLSGRWLQLPDHLKSAPRAWVAIIEQSNGGPGKELIRYRHRKWVTEELMRPSVSDLPRAELDARFRQCRDVKPRYFDAVLVQHEKATEGLAVCSWMIDWEIDQSLTDEHGGRAKLDLNPPQQSVTAWNTSVIEISRLADHHPIMIRVDSPFMVTDRESFEDPAAVSEAAKSSVPDDDPNVPKSLAAARKKLLQLDDISVRKQHLDRVVQAADAVLSELERWTSADDSESRGRQDRWVADTLYRRGRALGYMELPDVVAVHPVTNQSWLDAEFEATFQKLQSQVDVTDPKYILLTIRRERRRGHRGLALNLVDQYRKTHPAPVWHYKKRFDLLDELGVVAQAHQAACALWLEARKPDRPVCCVIRFDSMEPPGSESDLGSWMEKLPWRTARLQFHEVQPTRWEAAVWLSSPDKELSQRVLDSEVAASSPRKIGRATVRRFHLSER